MSKDLKSPVSTRPREKFFGMAHRIVYHSFDGEVHDITTKTQFKQFRDSHHFEFNGGKVVASFGTRTSSLPSGKIVEYTPRITIWDGIFNVVDIMKIRDGFTTKRWQNEKMERLSVRNRRRNTKK